MNLLQRSVLKFASRRDYSPENRWAETAMSDIQPSFNCNLKVTRNSRHELVNLVKFTASIILLIVLLV